MGYWVYHPLRRDREGPQGLSQEGRAERHSSLHVNSWKAVRHQRYRPAQLRDQKVAMVGGSFCSLYRLYRMWLLLLLIIIIIIKKWGSAPSVHIARFSVEGCKR